MASSAEVNRMWCRALCEEIGDRPDLIEKITTNYNRQSGGHSWHAARLEISTRTARRAGRTRRMQMSEFSVHDQPDFERVYDDDESVTGRRGDLQALLDLATGSMDFGSGFWDNEQVEIARKIAKVLGVDPLIVTPSNFTYQYGCLARGEHKWRRVAATKGQFARPGYWFCDVCRHIAEGDQPPEGVAATPVGQTVAGAKGSDSD